MAQDLQRKEDLSKTDLAILAHRKELAKAQVMVHTWLQQNGFDDLNRSKGFLIITYPLHEAVKQENAYIVCKLLMFGANPNARNTWNRMADEYVGPTSHPAIRSAFSRSREHKSLISEASSSLERFPPPRGFEQFFADLEQSDPLVVSSSEQRWLRVCGPRACRRQF
ncbi:Mitotic checkpoint protein BUB3.2 [Durusdinium trenchii]